MKDRFSNTLRALEALDEHQGTLDRSANDIELRKFYERQFKLQDVALEEFLKEKPDATEDNVPYMVSCTGYKSRNLG